MSKIEIFILNMVGRYDLTPLDIINVLMERSLIDKPIEGDRAIEDLINKGFIECHIDNTLHFTNGFKYGFIKMDIFN